MRILLVEDNPDDVRLLHWALRKHYPDLLCTVVDKPDDLRAALRDDTWQVVLSDHNMPGFRTGESLAIFQASGLLIPFIIVTGAIGEESAVSLLKAGVSDFVLKENLKRLPTAIENAIRQSTEHKAKLAAEKALLQAKNELEQRVIERTADLAARNAELQHSNRQLESAQKQLLLQEKMASLGTLTAGVAHEINNPINFVHIGNQNLLHDLQEFRHFVSGLLGDDTDPQIVTALMQRFDKLEEHSRLINDGSTRVQAILRDLRSFSRLDNAERKPVSLPDVLKSTVNLVASKFKDRLQIELHLCDCPALLGWPSQLAQVFMNLTVNACDAIISHQQEATALFEGKLIVTLHRDDANATVTIQDNGTGMSDDVLAHIFEPFYTTKPEGFGTGLGLSISWTIIEKHGGHIDVQSRVGDGSCFTVFLPLNNELTQTKVD